MFLAFGLRSLQLRSSPETQADVVAASLAGICQLRNKPHTEHEFYAEKK